MKKINKKTRHRLLRDGLAITICVLLVVTVVRNWGQFIDGMAVVSTVSPLSLLLMAAIFAITLMIGAMKYRILAFKKTSLKDALIVEVAAAGINREVPSGIGGMSAHGAFLHRNKHSLPQAVAVVTVNDALGIATHLMLITFALVLWPHNFTAKNFYISKTAIIAFAVASGIIGSLIFLSAFRAKVVYFLSKYVRSLGYYEKHWAKVVKAVFLSVAILILNVALYYFAIKSIGISTDIVSVFIIYSTGVLFGVITPTPGGVGGVEAGLIAGLTSKGVNVADAIAAAIVFRIVTFWLPLMVGPIALAVTRKRRLI